MQSENEIKTIPLKIASKRISHLEKDLTKEVQNLYSENYKILLKEIERILNKSLKFRIRAGCSEKDSNISDRNVRR